MSTVSEAASVAGIALVAGAAAIVSALQLSSLNAVWSMANQIQLMTLLVVMDTYLPETVISAIKGGLFANMNLSFLSIQKLPFLASLLEWLNWAKSEQRFADVEINFKSALYNNINLVFTLVLVAVLHLVL